MASVSNASLFISEAAAARGGLPSLRVPRRPLLAALPARARRRRCALPPCAVAHPAGTDASADSGGVGEGVDPAADRAGLIRDWGSKYARYMGPGPIHPLILLSDKKN